MSRAGLLLSVFDDPGESGGGLKAAEEPPTPVEETPLYRAGHAVGLEEGRRAAEKAMAETMAVERRDLEALRAALAEAVGAARESAEAAAAAAVARQSVLFAAALRAAAPSVADAAFIASALKALTSWLDAPGAGVTGAAKSEPPEGAGLRLRVSAEKRDALAAALADQPAPLADLELQIDPALRGAAMRLVWADGLAELNPQRCVDAIVAALPAPLAEQSLPPAEPASAPQARADEPAAAAADAPDQPNGG